MTTLIGMDLGVRKAAISIFHDGEMTNAAHITTPSSTRSLELRTLAEWTFGYTKSADYVFIEEPLVGRSTRVSLQIAQTAGAVLSTLGGMPGRDARLCDNKTWKKVLIGNGNASKDQIKSWLTERYPAYATLCGDNQDRIDATCIGIYGCQLVDRATQLAEL